MEEHGGTLHILLQNTKLSTAALKAEPAMTAGDYVELSVSDTGTGLTPALISKIFDPYFTTKEVGKGTGMGLAVVNGIVKSHDGFIRVTSQQGEGSSFSAFFPVTEGNTVDPTTNAEMQENQTGTERILFIDDEQLLASLGKAMGTLLLSKQTALRPCSS